MFLNSFHLRKPKSPSQQITVSTTAGTKMPSVEKQMDPTSPIIGSKLGTKAATPTVALTINVRVTIWVMLWYFSGTRFSRALRQVISIGT